MIRTVIFAVIIGTGLVSASSHGECVTTDDATTVNTTVQALASDPNIMGILSNTDLTSEQSTFLLLNTTCYTESVRTLANTLDTKIRACPALVDVTAVATLQLGDLSFSMLFTAFSSMDNFCGCFPALLQAGGIKQMAASLSLSIADGEYANVVNIVTLCMKEPPFNMREAVKLVASKLSACPVLVQTMGAPLLNVVNVRKMSAFVQKGYCDLTGVDFDCVKEKSASSEFKYCMDPSRIGDDVTADDKADRPSCKRIKCIEDKMLVACNMNSTIHYKWAVGMYGHEKDLDLTSDCKSAASGIIASILLIAMTSLMFVI